MVCYKFENIKEYDIVILFFKTKVVVTHIFTSLGNLKIISNANNGYLITINFVNGTQRQFRKEKKIFGIHLHALHRLTYFDDKKTKRSSIICYSCFLTFIAYRLFNYVNILRDLLNSPTIA